MVSQAGFLAFLRSTVGICAAALPDDDSDITDAYCYALEIVNRYIECIAPKLYCLAVYNLATDYLLNWASDVPGSTFFSTYRSENNLTAFVAGVISSTADESTSESLLVPDAFKELTISDLANLNTPYGRQYLAIAQRWGTLWGVS